MRAFALFFLRILCQGDANAVSKPAEVRTKVNGQKRAKKKVTLDATLNNNLGRRFWDSLYMHDIPTCQVCNKYKQIL